MVVNVCGTFVSQKIQKVRWKPDNLCDTIVSGSWDDDVSVLIYFFRLDVTKKAQLPHI